MAYARLHPDLIPPPTYESGSLRKFYLGRTDAIRSCSEETVRFTQTMQDAVSGVLLFYVPVSLNRQMSLVPLLV